MLKRYGEETLRVREVHKKMKKVTVCYERGKMKNKIKIIN